ncbi:ZN503-like protein [Mya arenaria]|uniref:ZN503-like protein n=1 Tax=Mya arenaria TaxID=6604 RepID=A0ABY7DF47_MYAAR|nr:zinc finger protein Noc-like [Mya arenaria]WAQ95340.1 ZN503-like protein [Mya arenaria]
MNESKSGDTPINMTSMSSMLAPNVAQYLHPDYLQPLPTTLDAKKSPLALLAQTCSSIGKDPSPSKSIIPPLEKESKDSDKASTDKAKSSENRKSPGNDSGNESGRESSKKSGLKAAAPKEIPPLVPISSTPSRKSSPVPSSSSEKSSETVTVTAAVSRPVASTGANSGHTSSGSVRSTNSVSSDRDRGDSDRERERERERNRSRDNGSSDGGKHTSRSSPDHVSVASKYPGHLHPGLNGFGSGLPHPGLSLYGHGLGLDPSSVSSAYASSLAAAHSGYNFSASAAAALAAQNAALSKSGLSPGLSPYVSYARVRTPSGATTLVPVCRDPYCTNCQLTIQNSHISSTCTSPGCSQCAHEKSLQSLSALGMAGASSLSMMPQYSLASSLPSLPPGLSSYPGLSSSLYAHSLLGSSAAMHSQGMPYVCNWVSGTDYCGKRYSTSEELLQHLRTHTSSSEAASSLASYAALGLPPPLGLPGFPPTPLPAHGGLSPNSLRRAYPTIPSPLGNMLNGSRYHPYKSPLPSVPSGLQPGQGLSSLSPYYSPYSLYGQRIGAAAVP